MQDPPDKTKVVGPVGVGDEPDAATAGRLAELEGEVQRLQRAEREQRMFASMAAHDLQAPLRAIRGYLRALDEDAGERLAPDERFLLQRAVDGAERMRKLIDALLTFSRIEASAVDVEVVSLDEALDEALDALETELDGEVTLTRGPLPAVTGCRPLLIVLLQNLLSNALKYCGESAPHIELSARRDGERWVVSVRDHGIGIPAAAGNRIFQPFGRAHDRSLSGSGLGLAVVMRSATRMRGHVWYESEVGVGTTFHVALPAADTAW